MIVLLFLLRGFNDYSHGASHPYIPIIALDPHIFDGSRINAATRMRTYTCSAYLQLHACANLCAACHHVLSVVKMSSCLVASRIQCCVAGFAVTAKLMLIL